MNTPRKLHYMQFENSIEINTKIKDGQRWSGPDEPSVNVLADSFIMTTWCENLSSLSWILNELSTLKK